MAMTRTRWGWINFSLGFVLGAGVWIGGFSLSGENEPWDSGYGFLALIVCELLLVFVHPRNPLWGLSGYYFGQLIVAVALLGKVDKALIFVAPIAVLFCGVVPGLPLIGAVAFVAWLCRLFLNTEPTRPQH